MVRHGVLSSFRPRAMRGKEGTMSKNGNGAVVTLGESALTGWRGAAGRAVARPIAKRTRFTEEQVRAAIGLAILLYGAYRLLAPAIRAARTRR